MDDDVEGEGQMNGMYRMYVQCKRTGRWHLEDKSASNYFNSYISYSWSLT